MSRFDPEKVDWGSKDPDAIYRELYEAAEQMAEAIERWRETGEDGDLEPALAAYRGEGES